MPSDGIGVASSVAWPPAQPYEEPPDDGKPHIWAQKGFQFHDFLDIINPLQHIPIIASIYRWITGEPIGNLPPRRSTSRNGCSTRSTNTPPSSGNGTGRAARGGTQVDLSP